MPHIIISGSSAAGLAGTLTIICRGPAGGRGFVGGNPGALGGDGGWAYGVFRKADLPASLAVWPGQGGRSATGNTSPGVATTYGGGGGAGDGNNAGGGGADFAGVFAAASVAHADALLIAGGGSGGPSQNATGADGGGTVGADGAVGGGLAGGVGGSQVSGGTGGPGGDGAALQGGTGVGGNDRGGGGGGAGYYGGEGGAGSPGGGGSGFLSPLALAGLLEQGRGMVATSGATHGADGEVLVIDNDTGVASWFAHTGSVQSYNV